MARSPDPPKTSDLQHRRLSGLRCQASEETWCRTEGFHAGIQLAPCSYVFNAQEQGEPEESLWILESAWYDCRTVRDSEVYELGDAGIRHRSFRTRHRSAKCVVDGDILLDDVKMITIEITEPDLAQSDQNGATVHRITSDARAQEHGGRPNWHCN